LLCGFATHRDSRVEGLSAGEKVEKIVEIFASPKGINHIKDVKIPFAAVTCDTVTMKECISVSDSKFKSSNENVDFIYDISLGKAVRASMSFPGIYTTCNHEKYNLIDGGTKDNLPVNVLKDMGADKIIAISFDLDCYKPEGKLFDVVIRALDIFSLDNVLKGRKTADISCIVKTEDTSLLEIKDTNAVVNAGYKAVMEHKEEILKILC
jgi:NTE family protein